MAHTDHPAPAPPDSMIPNMAWSVAAKGLQALTGFLVFLVIARNLAPAELGDYIYAMALAASVMSVSYFGIQLTVVREIAKSPKDAPGILGAGILIRLPLVLAAGAATWLFQKSIGGDDAVGAAMLFAIGAEGFRSLTQLAYGVFQGFERLKQEFALSVLVAGLWPVALAVAIFPGLTPERALGATFCVMGLCALASWAIVARNWTRPNLIDGLRRVRPMVSISFVIGLAVIANANLFRINTLLLTWLSSTQQTAYFQIGHDLVLKLQIMFMAAMPAVFPALARLTHNSDTRRTVRILGALHRTMAVFALGVALLLAILARPMIVRFYGADFGPSTIPLQILAWAMAPLALSILWGQALTAAGGQRQVLAATVGALAANALLSLILVPPFGATGAACSALAAYSACAGLLLRFSAQRGIAPKSLFRLLAGEPPGDLRALLKEVRAPGAKQGKSS